MRPCEQITVGDLMIRRWRPDDLQPLHAAVLESIEHLRPWMAWAADADLGAQRRYLEAAAAAWERDERYEYAIIHPRAGIIGSIALLARIGAGGLEIGYWVHSDHTGRGVASTSTAALAAAAFALPWVDLVEIHHDAANTASASIPARLGFQMIQSVPREPAAPADSGRDLIWRLSRDAYPASQCRALLESTGTPKSG